MPPAGHSSFARCACLLACQPYKIKLRQTEMLDNERMSNVVVSSHNTCGSNPCTISICALLDAFIAARHMLLHPARRSASGPAARWQAASACRTTSGCVADCSHWRRSCAAHPALQREGDQGPAHMCRSPDAHFLLQWHRHQQMQHVA